MINGELSVFLLTYMSPNTNVTHSIKARLVSFWSFGMYLSFEKKIPSVNPLTQNQQNTAFSNLWSTLYIQFKGIWHSTFWKLRYTILCVCHIGKLILNFLDIISFKRYLRPLIISKRKKKVSNRLRHSNFGGVG